MIVAQQTQNFFITFVQRRPNAFDSGPTLYKCYKNVLCLLGVMVTLIVYPERSTQLQLWFLLPQVERHYSLSVRGLTLDVRLRLKLIPALKELNIYNDRRPIT